LQLTSFKSNLQSSYSIASAVLRSIVPENPVSINRQDADKAGVKSGDKVRVVTPGGSQLATLPVRNGIAPGVKRGLCHLNTIQSFGLGSACR
jgi:tetrathionate reductase subunit A